MKNKKELSGHSDIYEHCTVTDICHLVLVITVIFIPTDKFF
jgi:hypothetical protein